MYLNCLTRLIPRFLNFRAAGTPYLLRAGQRVCCRAHAPLLRPEIGRSPLRPGDSVEALSAARIRVLELEGAIAIGRLSDGRIPPGRAQISSPDQAIRNTWRALARDLDVAVREFNYRTNKRLIGKRGAPRQAIARDRKQVITHGSRAACGLAHSDASVVSGGSGHAINQRLAGGKGVGIIVGR